MKKQKLLVPLAVPAMVLVGGLISGNTYADAGGLRVSAQTDDVSRCSIYTAGLPNTYSDCPSAFGSYSAGTINLGEGLDGGDLWIEGTYADGAVTISTAESLLNLDNIQSYRDLVFELAQNQISANKITIGGATMLARGNLTLKSGALTLTENVSLGDISVEMGSISTIGSITADNVTTSGGSIEITGNDLFAKESINVDGGDLTINSGKIVLDENDTSLTLTDGSISIDGKLSDTEREDAGIMNALSTGRQVVTINGGELNINNAPYGIKIEYGGGAISFNGGTTVIKNADQYAVYLRGSADPENDIAFGEGMGIKEKGITVFWDNTWQHLIAADAYTGICAPKIVTITSGYDYERTFGKPNPEDVIQDDEGESVDPDSGDTEDESDVKVPDTGANTDNKENSALSLIAAPTFMALSLAAIIASIKKRSAGHFKFDR